MFSLPINQVLFEANNSDRNLRPGFGPRSCPIFNFDQNPEDRTAGGNAIMKKLSLNAAIDEIGYVEEGEEGEEET